jgi:hypothetical protein
VVRQGEGELCEECKDEVASEYLPDGFCGHILFHRYRRHTVFYFVMNFSTIRMSGFGPDFHALPWAVRRLGYLLFPIYYSIGS